MNAPARRRSSRRGRRTHYIKRVGWIVFWASMVWTVIASTRPERPSYTLLGVGAAVLVLTQIAAWLLKRQRSRERSRGHSEARSSSRHAHRPAVPAGPIGDFAVAEDARRPHQSSGAQARTTRSYAISAGGRRRALRIVLFTAVLLPLLALTALWLCFEDRPAVVTAQNLSADSYEKAQQFLEAHDPRNAGAEGTRTLVASQEEVNIVANYIAKRFRNGAVRVALQPGMARIQATVPAPANPFGPWLNVEAVVRDTRGVPGLDKLRVGSLPVPGFVADFVLERVAAHFNAADGAQAAKDMVKSVTISDSQVRIVYDWREQLVTRARSALISPEDKLRFHAYVDRLFETVESSGRRQSMALSQLLPPMFLLAKQRAVEGDAAKENRAAIITLAFFAFGRDLSAIIPEAASWRAAVPLQVTLYDRDDTAQHFLVSAALAIEGGSALSDAIGVYREMDDSRRTGTGKGFSFQDLAADRAGTRFGMLAAQSPQKLQRSLTPGIKDSDVMPAFADLAQEIPEAEFKKRYGVGSPTYNNILADIEARVARTRLLQ